MTNNSRPSLSIRLFGCFKSHVDGHLMRRLRTRKGQWLFAMLVLRSDAELERDWLAAHLWPESLHAQALANLRGSLRDLRRELGGEAARLSSPTRCTLRFDASGAFVDVLAFDAAITRNTPSSLVEAVSLYRGPLLESCPEGWIFVERQRREQAYLQALEALAADARARGDLADAEQFLRRAAAVDPHRESAVRELMAVLAETGNYAAALEAFRDLRVRLHRELNAAPDRMTEALFEQIQRSAPRVATAATSPSGARRRPGKLPIPSTALLGRESELAVITHLLSAEATRLLTLTGPGGIGKTRLALAAADGIQSQFEDGAYLINLAPIHDPALIVATVAERLGVPEKKDRPRLDALKEHLQLRRMLLVLDNFEHILAGASIVANLLAEAPRLKILVTSRAPLHLRGEKLLAVPPLALPPQPVGIGEWRDGWAEGAPPAVLRPAPQPDAVSGPGAARVARYAAVQLFIERAMDVRPDFALTDENAPFVAAICRRLDGLPLAIELVAAHARLMSPHAMLARLDERLSLLRRGARDLPDRQRTLRDTIEWSYNLLSEGEKQLFRRLAVFENGCVLEAAEAVCSAIADLRIDLLDGVSALLDKNVLRQADPGERTSRGSHGTGVPRSGSDEPRFGMLETIREFSRERLVESGEEGVIRRQHACYFLNWAEAVDRSGWGQAGTGWLERAEREHNNLRAALAWALESAAAPGETEAAELGLRLAAALSPFWTSCGHQREAREWLERLLAVPAPASRTSAWARAFELFGDLVWELGDHQEGLRLAEESLALWQELGDRPGIARALYSLGWRHHIFDRHEAARRYFESSLALFEGLGDRRSVARLLNGLGGLAYRSGDLDTACRFVQRSVDRYRELGDCRGMAGTMGNLALFAACRNDHETARRVALEWLEVVSELHDSRMMVMALHRLGIASFALGDVESAREHWGRALTMLRQQEDASNPSFLLNCLGSVAYVQGDLKSARALYEEARQWAEKQSSEDVSRVSHLASALMGLADVACAEGDLWTAGVRYAEAIEVWRQVKGTSSVPQFGPTPRVARCLDGLANVAAKRGEAERAARLLARAAATREALGFVLSVPEEREWQSGLEHVRRTLGEAAFAVAWELGRGMAFEDAIVDALEIASGAAR